MNEKLSSRDISAERRLSLSRRRFLHGVGACVALPAFESLLPSVAFTPRRLLPNARRVARRRTRAHGVCLLSRTARIRPTGGRKAKEQDFELAAHHAAAGNGQAPAPGARRTGPRQRHARPRRRRRPRPRQRHVPHRRPRPQDGRRGHSSRRLDRPGRRPTDRPPHAIPVAGADLRRGPQERQLRLRATPAPINTIWPGDRRPRRSRRSRTRGCCSSGCSAKARPASGKANMRRRQEQQRSILDFVLDDAQALGGQLGKRDRAKARRIPDQRSRDRKAHRAGRALRRQSARSGGRHARRASRRASRSTSG